MQYSPGVCSLEVSVSISADAGTYTCIAENSQGSAETFANVTINGIIQDFQGDFSLILATSMCQFHLA